MNHSNELVAIINDNFAKQTEYTTDNGKIISWADVAQMYINDLNADNTNKVKSGIECFVNNFNYLKQTSK